MEMSYAKNLSKNKSSKNIQLKPKTTDGVENVDEIEKVKHIKVAILVGFCYEDSANDDDVERRMLPGIVIDLYQAYKQALLMKADKIVIITDLTEDKRSQTILNALLVKIVETGILAFINDIKKFEYYNLYQNYDNLLDILEETSENASNIFFYYTGHASQGYLRLPRMSKLFTSIGNEDEYDKKHQISMILIRNLFLSKSIKGSDIFIIFDCCNGSGINLPYTHEETSYKMVSPLEINKKKFHRFLDILDDIKQEEEREERKKEEESDPREKDRKGNNQNDRKGRKQPDRKGQEKEDGTMDHEFFSNRIICVSASRSHEVSITTKDGSLFSLEFFKLLKEKNMELGQLINLINKKITDQLKEKQNNRILQGQRKIYLQNAMIYCSHPDEKYPWDWLQTNIYSSININFKNRMIEFRRPGITINTKSEPAKTLNVLDFR